MKINVKNLRKAFGETVAVDIEEYKVGAGELIGLVGNNGAGKTTMFRLLLDLLKADNGNVEYEIVSPTDNETIVTVDPAQSEDWKNYTGSYIDDGFLIDFLTPEDYFSFIGKVCGIKKEDIEQRLVKYEHFMAGEILGLKKLIRDLSAGNKHKVGIVAALLNEPELLILDEPFNFLDPTSQNVLKNVLREYHESSGATIIISSHNLAHTIDICPRITLLEHGKIIKDLENIEGSAEKELDAYFNGTPNNSGISEQQVTG